jgi:hypothetical protein
VDVDGNGSYNPNPDYPEVTGDQMLWWIMNDNGNTHQSSETPAMKVEVQVSAFAFNQSGAIGNTTFYKYNIVYKGSVPLVDAYMSIWSDPDLGDSGDDFVGSDSTLGLGFVYNGDNFDSGSTGYGDKPPALGYDFFQGPLVDNDGKDNDGDGEVDETGERLGMTGFIFFNNDSTPQGNPGDGPDFYKYMEGVWLDGTQITFGGNGTGGSEPTKYMYPADPPRFWSEDNIDGTGARNTPSDRRFVMSSGPFTIEPGDSQEIIFGIVWSQTSNRHGSVAQLKLDDIIAQGAFDLNFDLPDPVAAPDVEVTELDGQIILNWSNEASSNNYLETYEAPSPFLSDPAATDTTMNFEGYIVREFESTADPVGRILTVYDVPNAIDIVTGPGIDPETGAVIVQVLVPGTDQGVKRTHVVDQSIFSAESVLRNNTDYHFGIQAYAFNQFSTPAVWLGPIQRVTVQPTLANNVGAQGVMVKQDVLSEEPTQEFDGLGSGAVTVTVSNPALVTGNPYEVRFYTEETGEKNYSIYEMLPNQERLAFDGSHWLETRGTTAPGTFGSADVPGATDIELDGLTFVVTDNEDFNWNARHPLEDETDFGTGRPIQREFWLGQLELDGQGNIVPKAYHPEVGTIVRMYSVGDDLGGACPYGDKGCFAGDFDGDGVQDTVRAITEVAGPGGADPCTDAAAANQCRNGERIVDYPFFSSDGTWSMVVITTQSFGNLPNYQPQTFEIRFTATQDRNDLGVLKEVAPFTAGDPLPVGSFGEHIFEDETSVFQPYEVWDIGTNRPGEANDAADDVRMIPFALADSYGFGPYGNKYSWGYEENGPGCEDLLGPGAFPANLGCSDRIYAYYGVDPAAYERAAAVTSSRLAGPVIPGDVFRISTGDIAPKNLSTEEQAQSIENITIVPNPYRGSSEYEVSRVVDVARITNLPERATIRIFTLDGTLIRTLEKSGEATWVAWDLNTQDGLPIASGLYLIHVEAKDSSGNTFGTKVLKFAAVKKRIQLNEL